MHHPSCPARRGTGPCICPPGKGPQVPNPSKPKPGTKPKVTPRPKKGR